jgi:abortive infection bacteriophage resistance protein
MGLNLHSELSSWLEAITYVRNIVAHHSRLWSRSMVKRLIEMLSSAQIVNDVRNRIRTVRVASKDKKELAVFHIHLYPSSIISYVL